MLYRTILIGCTLLTCLGLVVSTHHSIDTSSTPLQASPSADSLSFFDPRFVKLSPQEIALIPPATSYTFPMGTNEGAFTYNAQKFWTLNHHRRGYHSGEDLNGIGGGNSDFGDSVYSIADGLVLYSGEPSLGWGQVIIVGHRDQTNGQNRIIQSLYAHLAESHISVGQFVKKGEIIGKVGSASGQYLAHLHFEIRQGSNLYIGPGYLQTPGTQLSAETFLKNMTK